LGLPVYVRKGRVRTRGGNSGAHVTVGTVSKETEGAQPNPTNVQQFTDKRGRASKKGTEDGGRGKGH